MSLAALSCSITFSVAFVTLIEDAFVVSTAVTFFAASAGVKLTEVPAFIFAAIVSASSLFAVASTAPPLATTVYVVPSISTVLFAAKAFTDACKSVTPLPSA